MLIDKYFSHSLTYISSLNDSPVNVTSFNFFANSAAESGRRSKTDLLTAAFLSIPLITSAASFESIR